MSNKKNLIRESFYWVKYTQHGKWEPAYLDHDGNWKAIGFSGNATVIEVGEFIKKYGDE